MGDGAKIRDRRGEYIRKRARVLAGRPPDPLQSLTEIELAYIAGIIDGEGSVHVTGSYKQKTCYPNVAVNMTHRGVINWLALKWGNITVSRMTRGRPNPRHLPQFVVRLTGKRAQLLCELLLPYLIVKRRQAELILQFPCDVRIAPGVRIASSINEERLRFRDQINALNHRPRNPSYRRAAAL